MNEMPKAVLGLTQIVAQPLERVPVRRRESQATTSAWRLALSCDQGAGGIARVEISAEEAHYRGDGLFLGWPQAQMAELYRTITDATDKSGSDLELPQLG